MKLITSRAGASLIDAPGEKQFHLPLQIKTEHLPQNFVTVTLYFQKRKDRLLIST